jgi:hypothetical protein
MGEEAAGSTPPETQQVTASGAGCGAWTATAAPTANEAAAGGCDGSFFKQVSFEARLQAEARLRDEARMHDEPTEAAME